MHIKVCEPKEVRAIPIEKLLQRIRVFAEVYPGALVAMNELNACLDLYEPLEKGPGNNNHEYIAQFLWE